MKTVKENYFEQAQEDLENAIDKYHKDDDDYAVNSPDHYMADGLEAIEVMEAFLSAAEFGGFCKGNALKYLMRAGRKYGNSPVQDMKKARWYINRWLEVIRD